MLRKLILKWLGIHNLKQGPQGIPGETGIPGKDAPMLLTPSDFIYNINLEIYNISKEIKLVESNLDKVEHEYYCHLLDRKEELIKTEQFLQDIYSKFYN